MGWPGDLPSHGAGWAVAFDAPFTWTKQVASDFGGTRNGMIVHWPEGIKEKGGIRSQFGHVIDIAPTILEAAGLPEPKSVNGTPQTPIEGTSLLYTRLMMKVPKNGTQPSTSRCLATERSITMAGSHGRFTERHGKPSICLHWRQISGICTMFVRTSSLPITWLTNTLRSLPSCRHCS